MPSPVGISHSLGKTQGWEGPLGGRGFQFGEGTGDQKAQEEAGRVRVTVAKPGKSQGFHRLSSHVSWQTVPQRPSRPIVQMRILRLHEQWVELDTCLSCCLQSLFPLLQGSQRETACWEVGGRVMAASPPGAREGRVKPSSLVLRERERERRVRCGNWAMVERGSGFGITVVQIYQLLCAEPQTRQSLRQVTSGAPGA